MANTTVGGYSIMIGVDLGNFKNIGKEVSTQINAGLKDLDDYNFDNMSQSLSKGIKKGLGAIDKDSLDKSTKAGKNSAVGFSTSFANSMKSMGAMYIINGALKAIQAGFSVTVSSLTTSLAALAIPAKIAITTFQGVTEAAISTFVSGVKVSVAAGAASIAATITSSFREGMDLEQNLGGIEAVFKSTSDSMKEWAASTATISGFSMNQALSNATTLGQILQASGIEETAANNLTKTLLQRAADAASVLGTSTEEAIQNLTSGLKGNIEVLDNIGAPLTAAMLQQYALSKGIDKATLAADSQVKTMLTAQYILEKTSNFAGNFVKENESLAGSIQIITASWKSFTSSLVTGDASLIASSGQAMNDAIVNFGNAIVKNIGNIVGGSGLVIATIIPTIISTLTASQPAILSAFNDMFTQIFTSLSDNRFFSSITALLMNGLSSAANFIMTNAGIIFNPILDGIQNFFLGIAGLLFDGENPILPFITDVFIPTIGNALLENSGAIAKIGVSLFTVMISGFTNFAPQLIKTISSMIPGIIEGLYTLYDSVWTYIIPGLLNAFSANLPAILQLIRDQIDNLTTFLPYIIGELVSAIGNNRDMIMSISGGIWDLMITLMNEMQKAGGNPEFVAAIAAIGINIFGGILVGMKSFLPQIIQFITTALYAPIDMLAKWIMSVMPGIGGQIISGLIRGLLGGVPGLLDTLNMIFGWFPAQAEKTLEIHSPSRVMQRIGGYTIDGLAVGLSDYENKLSSPISGISDYITDGLSTNVDISGGMNAIAGRNGTIVNQTFEVQPVDTLADRRRELRRSATTGIKSASLV